LSRALSPRPTEVAALFFRLGAIAFGGTDFPWYLAGCGAAWLAGRTIQS
jgi:hypothetical protein